MERRDTPADSRRKSQRAGVVMRLQYRNAGHLLVSYCTNLSRGGLFVPATDPLPPGTRITLSLAIPGADDAQLEAEVRWVRQFDADEGPAGMGLSFEDVDDVLGDRIDFIVSDFAPLEIAIVGDRGPVRSHIAAQVRTLVSCVTSTHAMRELQAADYASHDLVIVDADSAFEAALELLEGLGDLKSPPPRLVLCSARNSERRRKVTGLARVVNSPVDAEELRTSVLETVTEVQASRTDGGKPED